MSSTQEKALGFVVNGGEEKKVNDCDMDRKAIEIGIRFRIDQLTEIDTLAQSYQIIGVIDMDWEATEEEFIKYSENKKEYLPNFIPRLDPKNVIEKEVNHQPWSSGNHVKALKHDNKYYNLRRIEYRAIFSELFEVSNYPFDVQDLTFVFQNRSYNLTRRYELVPSHVFDDFFRIETTYLSVCDWELIHYDAWNVQVNWDKVLKLNLANSGDLDEENARRVARMYFRIQVKRKAFPVMTRVVSWMCLLGIFSFGNFAMPVSNIGDRLGYNVTMVLAVIAFQFVIATLIPNVPYLTIIDKYNLSIFIFVLLITIEAVVCGWHDNDSEIIEKIDNIIAMILGLCFIIGHIFFIIYVYIKQQYENNKQEKIKELMGSIPEESVKVYHFSHEKFSKVKEERTKHGF